MTIDWVATILVAVLLLSVLPLGDALAATKRKGKKKNASASTRKGFGVAPVTLSDIASSLRHALPADPTTVLCPCRQGKGASAVDDSVLSYADCCQPHHWAALMDQGIDPTIFFRSTDEPSTLPEGWKPRQVLQSRYTAFSYRLIPYIIYTTHTSCQYWQPNTVKWAQKLDTDGTMDTFNFLGLTVVEDKDIASEKDDENDARKQATLTFRSHVRAKATGDEAVLKEISIFVRENDNMWFYASGKARPEPVLKAQTATKNL